MIEDRQQPIYLSKADWEEIFYALESKMKGVFNGEYGTGRSKSKWVKHLKSIMATIGPDGEIAIEKGVEPLGDEDRITFDGPTLPGGVLVLESDMFDCDNGKVPECHHGGRETGQG